MISPLFSLPGKPRNSYVVKNTMLLMAKFCEQCFILGESETVNSGICSQEEWMDDTIVYSRLFNKLRLLTAWVFLRLRGVA